LDNLLVRWEEEYPAAFISGDPEANPARCNRKNVLNYWNKQNKKLKDAAKGKSQRALGQDKGKEGQEKKKDKAAAGKKNKKDQAAEEGKEVEKGDAEVVEEEEEVKEAAVQKVDS
jgi:hypothetical protein